MSRVAARAAFSRPRKKRRERKKTFFPSHLRWRASEARRARLPLPSSPSPRAAPPPRHTVPCSPPRRARRTAPAWPPTRAEPRAGRSVLGATAAPPFGATASPPRRSAAPRGDDGGDRAADDRHPEGPGIAALRRAAAAEPPRPRARAFLRVALGVGPEEPEEADDGPVHELLRRVRLRLQPLHEQVRLVAHLLLLLRRLARRHVLHGGEAAGEQRVRVRVRRARGHAHGARAERGGGRGLRRGARSASPPRDGS